MSLMRCDVTLDTSASHPSVHYMSRKQLHMSFTHISASAKYSHTHTHTFECDLQVVTSYVICVCMYVHVKTRLTSSWLLVQLKMRSNCSNTMCS